VDEKALLVNLWPQGSKGTFALNSNHEMYCGGKGYFETIRGPKWGNQGFSCFALHNNDWLIVGLDTAYFAFYQSWLYEEGYLSDDNRRQPRGMVQINWLKALLGEAQHARKRLMILTHHDGFDVKVGEAKKKGLYNELKGYVNNDRDCFWYWGHVHGGLVYKPIPLGTNTNLYARCVGHGGVPYAPYPELSTLGQDGIAVQWAEQENASTGDSRRPPLNLDGLKVAAARADSTCGIGRRRFSSRPGRVGTAEAMVKQANGRSRGSHPLPHHLKCAAKRMTAEMGWNGALFTAGSSPSLVLAPAQSLTINRTHTP
jgi:hypothetical protein